VSPVVSVAFSYRSPITSEILTALIERRRVSGLSGSSGLYLVDLVCLTEYQTNETSQIDQMNQALKSAQA
jgi:hypothetical protein